MPQSSVRTSASSNDTVIRWDGASGQILVDIKSTNSMRDVRGALLALAYLIADGPAKSRAVCVFVGTRLSVKRLQEELTRFRQVCHPSIAQRIHFLLVRRDNPLKAYTFVGSMDPAPDGFLNWLAQRVSATAIPSLNLQLPARQTVVAALAQLRLWHAPAVSVKYLQESCRVSYPTVAAVLKDLDERGWLEDAGKRGVRLRPLLATEWMAFATEHARQRKVCFFTDPTGLISAERLAQRLVHLRETGKLKRSVCIGGVIGASHHFPDLDITAASRLDVCVEDDPGQIAALLDAGLIPKTRPEQRVVLAIHVTNDLERLAGRQGTDTGPWAGVLECLADLVELGYTREAAEMAQQVESQT